MGFVFRLMQARVQFMQLADVGEFQRIECLFQLVE
jgi:hypothetical protein